MLFFIPSICLLGYQKNIFPGSWQIKSVSEQRGKSEGERGKRTESENVRSARIPVGKIDWKPRKFR